MENTIRKKRQSDNAFFHLMLSLFLVFWMNAGLITFLNVVPGIRYIKLLVVFLWGITALSRDSMFFLRFFKLAFPLLLCFIIIYFEKIFGISEFAKYADITLDNIYYMLIITALFSFYIDDPSESQKRIILYAWFLDIIICGIITLRQLELYPMLSRVLSTGNPLKHTELSILPKGILSFGNAYSFVFCIFALCLHLKKDVKKGKLFTYAAIAYMCFLLVEMQFAMSFLLAVFAFVLFWCIGRTKKKQGIVLILLLPVALLLLTSFWEHLLDLFIDIAGDNDELAIRFYEIKAFLARENIAGTDLNARLIKYTTSFKSIFSNYFMGALFVGNGEIGEHSELLDCLATYGIFPFLCLIWYFKSLYAEIIKVLHKANHVFLKAIFLLFLILSIINTSLWCPIMLGFILIVPLLFLNYESKSTQSPDAKK